ncbi:TPA: hypothetical protein I8Y58_000290 [Legionella pneumophila]|uniref:Transmembrane protein n=1 Tax=Legionella pneumophila TaxID=446 RepID=A0AAN5KNU2_LEGPN|nr:hypothetical protein [Legionella pneumophila]HAT1971696.1 hypothetical protein [Legionella pneumophila]
MPDLLVYCLIATAIDKMNLAGNFILKQSRAILENKQYAIVCAVVLSIVPFASWLSVALMSLITLRKGEKPGFEVMLPAMIVHSVPLMMLLPLEGALINTLVAYLPCYLAALTLRKTASWPNVFGVFLIQAFIVFLSIQIWIPDFVSGQFNHFKMLLSQFQNYKQLVENSTDGLNNLSLAQLFFGVQILSVITSALISLMFARTIQAKLFMPGGFKQEILEFRGGRFSFLMLIIVSVASYFEVPAAISTLPLLLAYFFLSGFSLAYYILARKWQIRVVILLSLLILLKPFFVLFAYIVFGSLDSLFNFRLYLPARVREST